MARITVEDALKRVNNRFVIAHMAMQRVRMYREGYQPLIETDNKEVVTALREIEAGKVILKKPLNVTGIEPEES
ncbi:MAG: DNA-directed RNA polymerase subunit omega [Desulfohalobiaceae bacterium]|nr:DNA-directed RNA polymerase subunit omega [Desulfohalobiaceae bacterium]